MEVQDGKIFVNNERKSNLFFCFKEDKKWT